MIREEDEVSKVSVYSTAAADHLPAWEHSGGAWRAS